MLFPHRISKPFLLLTWCLWLFSCQQQNTETPEQQDFYQVIAIKDGDTIEILKDGKPLRVRLQGVDCPEKRQDFGTRAQQFTAELVFGKRVALVVHDTDRYGRTVGEILLQDGRNLGHELVRNGFAWHYTAYSKDPELARLEAVARLDKRGLWQDPHAVAPWTFRRPGAAKPALAKKESEKTTTSRTGKAYRCSSKTAQTYHLSSTCHLLKRCKQEIATQTIAQAKAQSRTACRVCAQ